VSRRKSTGQELAKGPPEQKQQTNVYTVMLIISFAAICVACVLLWAELQVYGPFPWWKTDGVSPAGTSQVVPPDLPTLKSPAVAARDIWSSRMA
jgi:hypothetical protein